MIGNAPLYNVNQIVVEDGLQEAYIKFSAWLNEYLQLKYGCYYNTLQLYQNDLDSTLFFVIASYYDKPGVEEAAIKIGIEVGAIYDRVWGDKVQRTSIFTFLNFTRVIPPQRF